MFPQSGGSHRIPRAEISGKTSELDFISSKTSILYLLLF